MTHSFYSTTTSASGIIIKTYHTNDLDDGHVLLQEVHDISLYLLSSS